MNRWAEYHKQLSEHGERTMSGNDLLAYFYGCENRYRCSDEKSCFLRLLRCPQRGEKEDEKECVA